MVTVGKSGFSLSLCASLSVEEAVLHASTGPARVRTPHYNVHRARSFKNRFLRHLTYILHGLALLRRLTYLRRSFNPPSPLANFDDVM